MYVCTNPLGLHETLAALYIQKVVTKPLFRGDLTKPLGLCTYRRALHLPGLHTYIHTHISVFFLQIQGCFAKPLDRGGFVHTERLWEAPRCFFHTFKHKYADFSLFSYKYGGTSQSPYKGVLHKTILYRPIKRGLCEAPRGFWEVPIQRSLYKAPRSFSHTKGLHEAPGCLVKPIGVLYTHTDMHLHTLVLFI